MKVLFIGNSFSYDANIYLAKMAKAAGAELTALNLYIGGCSFERHAKNACENLAEYQPQYNGVFYPEYRCTVEDGLRFADWDVVSIQQVSGLSGIYESFFPYAQTVVDKVRLECPRAKIVMHETWAYEKGAAHGDFVRYGKSQMAMHKALHDAYTRVAKEVGCDAVIPVGDVIAALREYPTFDVERDGESLSRDGFHLGLTHGRYAAAATWFTALGLGDPSKLDFEIIDPEYKTFGLDAPAASDPEKVALIHATVKRVCPGKLV